MGITIENIVVEHLEYHVPYTAKVMTPEEEARMMKLMDHFYSFTRPTEDDKRILEERREIQYQLNTKFYGLA
jgi:hypothetical protein